MLLCVCKCCSPLLTKHGYDCKPRSLTHGRFTCSFTATSEAEAVRSALDDLQQAGLGIREMSMQFCETFADAVTQQLLRQPLSMLTAMRFDLTDAQYSSIEV